MLKNKININYFDSWSSNMAYILGFITGDGSIHYKGYNGLKGEGYKLAINLQYKDTEIITFIRNELAPSNKIYEYKFGELLTTGKQRHQSSLTISSKLLMDRLINFGITPQKTGKETLPNIPDKFFGDYLRGIFDADGTISSCEYFHKPCQRYYTTYYWQLVSASKKYLKSIKSRLNIDMNLRDHPPNCFKLDTRKKSNLPYLYDLMYSSNTFSLSRKKQKFEEIIKWVQ